MAAGAVLFAALLPGSGAASAAENQLLSLTATPEVSVSGLGAATVVFSATVTAQPPVATCALVGTEPLVFLSLHRGTAASTESTQVRLRLASGTHDAGTWTGSWRVASTYSGVWTVESLAWCDGALTSEQNPNEVSFDPTAVLGHPTAISVHGSQIPTMSMRRVPTVAAYGARQYVTWTFRRADGTPLAGRLVGLGRGEDCELAQAAGLRRLDSYGRITVTATMTEPACVNLANPVSSTSSEDVAWIFAVRSVPRYWFKTVHPVPISTSFRVGTAARVRTDIAPDRSWAELQVLYGRTWRTVYRRYVPPFTSRVQLYVPAGTSRALVGGSHLYRVRATSSSTYPQLAPTYSATFRMTGV